MTINVASLQRLNYVECIGLIFKNLDHWQWLQSGSGKPRVARQMPHAKLLKQWNTKDACTIDKLQLAVSEYTSPVSKPSNHPTNQFTTHKINSLPKWASDELTAWLKKINLPTNHQVPTLLILLYVLHLRCKVDIRTRHISLLLSTQCIQGVHELLHSSMEICNQDLEENISLFTTVYGSWNAYGYEEMMTRKFTSNFRISNQGVLNFNIFEIGHKQTYGTTSFLFSGSLSWSLKNRAKWCHVQLFESIFYLSCGDPGPISDNPNPEVAELVAGIPSHRGDKRQESTKWTVGKGGVRKKKNRRWRSNVWAQAPLFRRFFFCHAFLTPPFEARKKHLRWTFRAQWTTFTSNIRMKRTCFIYIWVRISEHKRTNW